MEGLLSHNKNIYMQAHEETAIATVHTSNGGLFQSQQ